MKLAAAAAACIFLGLACIASFGGRVELSIFWSAAFLWAGLYAVGDD